MRFFNLVMFFAFLQNSLFSQSETMPVILVSSDTKVTYQNNKSIDVIPGSIMNKNGTLKINPNGRAIVYHNFMFVEVTSDKSPVDLNKLFDNDELMITKSEQAFGNKMSDAVYNASKSGVKMKNQNALVSGWGDKTGSGKDGWGDKTGSGKDGWGDKTGSGKDGWGDKTGSGKDGWGDKTGSGKDGWGDKTGSGKDGWGDKTGSGRDGWGDKTGSGKDGWGDKTGSGKDGWGDKTGSGKDGWGDKTGSGKDGWGDKTGSGKDGWGKQDIMTRSASPGGRYIEGLNKVSWEPLKGTKKYTFVIEDMNHKLVFTTQVNGTEYSFDSKACKLTPGNVYAWYVHHPNKKQVSTPVFFMIVDKGEEEIVLEKIKATDIYKKSNSVIKLLMEAHQMEEADYLLAAQMKYKKSLESEPNNSLAKMMYSLFCKNMNEIKSAVDALK
jgi:uncharacterized protein (UPF0248 family)